MSRVELHLGDALDVLPRLPAHSFDVGVADPPYIIGGTSIAEPGAKSGTWADMVNAASWYQEWFDLVSERLKPDAYLLVFGNWRSLPTYLCASARSRHLRPQSCMVWDKLWIGPAGKSQLRPRWELILWLAMPDAQVADRAASDVVAEKWMAGNMGTTGHPAEKPVDLIVKLLKWAAPRGGSVLDPFAGRASVGIAAIRAGMSYTGIEVDPEHRAAGQRRLDGDEARQVQGGLVFPCSLPPLASAGREREEGERC